MSNRRRSAAEKTVLRFGKMAEGYQEKINSQVEIINRMMTALATAQDALYGIEHEAKDVRTARKWAKDAAQKINSMLEAKGNTGE